MYGGKVRKKRNVTNNSQERILPLFIKDNLKKINLKDNEKY